jgi:hypothetical protein
MKEETRLSPMGAAARVREALLLVLWTAAATGSPFAPALASGLLLVLLGVLVLALPPSAGAVRATFGARSAWENVSRLSWTSGAVAAIVLFVRALGLSAGGIEELATGMALAFVPAVVGLVLASLALAVAFRLPPPSDQPTPVAPRGTWATWLGRLLFLWLVACAALLPRLEREEVPFEPWQWLLHGPALLLLAGATLGLLLLFGRTWRRLAPVALALAGTLAALVGLVQALLGMAHVSITQVTAGTQSITTACFVALLALALVSISPRETESHGGDGARTAANAALALFPLVCLLLLAVQVVIVMTPMKVPL